ncbi:hypothetical protein TRFO_13243 [Tritrichomonas foetus]|uniref:Uncharacterized protein n=1 Tax=Tritrichomonas foetus TaxID=1144522 RepID=A0A1J4KZU0_9EUKA|nr:hypothetical protein TRFO_13243 [Tritrichomonas foetus]|eukprot:OHT16384.1 hypothetical protein TRFO_13243 [Tritrichomonas foetus]
MKNHRLIKWTLTPFKFIFDIISPIMIYPTCAIVGNSIRYLVLTKDKMNWIYLIVGLIMFIYFFALNYFGFSLYAHSTIFIKSPLSCFDLRALKMMPFVNSAFLFFAFIFSLFDSWAMIIVQIAHIAIGLICYYSIIYLPFHTEIGNILFLSVNCAGFINDIIMIILHFLDIKKRIGLIIPFVILVLCLVIFYFVVHFRVKSLIKFLTELEINNDLKEEEKFAIFESIPFFQSEEKAKMSLHIGFTNALEIFYTWSLLRYIIVNYNSVNTILDGIRYTSFFPGESRLLNSFFINITTKRGLSLSQRFFVFEVYKVKTIRQSSVSNDANSRLVELKSISNQCFEDLISFWINKNATVSYFEMLAAENGKAHAKWEESIRDYPNNPKFADEYCSYLIECESNYIDALKMKHRADCIELGKNFASDVTFKSLARSYPVYLKKKIIDFHGNLKRGTRRQAGSARNTENSAINGTTLNSMSSSTASGLELDAEVEDSLAKQLFRQSAIRLGMHRALANRKSSASNLMIFSGIFALIVGLGSFIGLFAYINGYAKQRSGSLTYVGQISNSKFYLDLAIVGTTLKFAYFTGRFKNYELFRQLEDEIETEPLLSVNKDMSHNIHGNAIKSRTFFSRFLESLAVLSNQGKQIYEIASSMMVNEVPFYTCFSGLPSNNVTSSIKAQQSYLFFAVDRASYHTANDSWFHIDEICEIMANQPSFSQYSFKIFSSLNNHQDALCQEEENTLFLLMIIFPIVLFAH